MTVEPSSETIRRARVHHALSDPIRLTIVDALTRSDRTPGELSGALEVGPSLLAHHLRVLEEAGVIARRPSSGDGRRSYLRLRSDVAAGPAPVPIPARAVLFVCTHNSARSQLAAALWNRSHAARAQSAGTHPASRVHPGALRAARRLGLDLRGARPRRMDQVSGRPDLIVTVCDQAREELRLDRALHWSVPDPVERGTPAAFSAAAAEIEARVGALMGIVDAR